MAPRPWCTSWAVRPTPSPSTNPNPNPNPHPNPNQVRPTPSPSTNPTPNPNPNPNPSLSPKQVAKLDESSRAEIAELRELLLEREKLIQALGREAPSEAEARRESFDPPRRESLDAVGCRTRTLATALTRTLETALTLTLSRPPSPNSRASQPRDSRPEP